MEFLFLEWLGKPAWMWLGFLAIVGVLLALDLGVLHRKQKEIGVGESLALSAGYLALGVGFAGLVWWQLGETDLPPKKWTGLSRSTLGVGRTNVAQC